MWELRFDYFRSLAKLGAGMRAIHTYLDTPLQAAIHRSRLASLWTALFGFLSLAVVQYEKYVPAWLQSLPAAPRIALFIVLGLALSISAAVILYGLLRLFTLVSHNLTTNLLKVRGQRLRLLNVYTTLLSLMAPLFIGLLISRWLPMVGLVLMVVCGAYALVILALSYNVVFHQQGWHGLRLVVLGLLITLFVLAIGALAIAVACAVIAFFVIVLLRPVLHR